MLIVGLLSISFPTTTSKEWMTTERRTNPTGQQDVITVTTMFQIAKKVSGTMKINLVRPHQMLSEYALPVNLTTQASQGRLS